MRREDVLYNAANKDNRIKKIKSLSNASIAMFITVNHHIRYVTSGDGEGTGLGVYITEGLKAGIYSLEERDLTAIIRRFKFCLEEKDVKNIVSILVNIIEPIPICSDKDSVPFGNCIYNYKTKSATGYSPDICFTKKLEVDYIVAPLHSPQILQDDGTYWNVDDWIASLSDDPDVIDLLWKVIGAVLRPNVRWNVIPCLYAEGGMNGKGTFCELLRGLIGYSNCISIPFSEFSKPSYACQLVKKMAVINDENEIKYL